MGWLKGRTKVLWEMHKRCYMSRDEACNTTIYVKIRSPYWIIRTSTPEEYFLGKKPDVAHFSIFSSLVYYHVTKDVTKNLEPTTELGIFVGYNDIVHKYRVYLSSHSMTMVCRDVKFNEEKAMRCFLKREF